MRRTIPFPVFAVTTVVAVLAVTVGVAVGQTIGGHGGTPTDVYTQKLGSPNDEPCADVTADGTAAMPQGIEVSVPSLVVAIASFGLETLDSREVVVSHLELDGLAGGPIGDTWFTALSPKIAAGSGVLTWSWSNVLPGPHTVSVYAAVQAIPGKGHGGSDLFTQMQNCSLTVFVSPME